MCVLGRTRNVSDDGDSSGAVGSSLRAVSSFFKETGPFLYVCLLVIWCNLIADVLPPFRKPDV